MAPGGDKPGDEKKIFVKSDESWKAEAQKEKERLQQKAGEAAGEAGEGDIPPAGFLALVSDLGLQAMLAMGMASVKGVEPRLDLPSARYAIDLLGMLQEKTRGNLTAEEKDHLDDLVSNLRMGFVGIARANREGGEKKP